MGRVLMGDHVEIGAGSDVAMGACGDTVIEDYVKVDALAYTVISSYPYALRRQRVSYVFQCF